MEQLIKCNKKEKKIKTEKGFRVRLDIKTYKTYKLLYGTKIGERTKELILEDIRSKAKRFDYEENLRNKFRKKS